MPCGTGGASSKRAVPGDAANVRAEPLKENRGKTMKIETKKNLLVAVEGEERVFFARKSETVAGAIDVVHPSGMLLHPSPAQARKMSKKAGVPDAEFMRAFGHLF